MKQFLCKWGEGYIKQCEKVLKIEDFSEEYGWCEDYIERIQKAGIGEVVDCSDYSGVLFVQRIE
jgi:hypothetical protein